jgi:hypothetical protein
MHHLLFFWDLFQLIGQLSPALPLYSPSANNVQVAAASLLFHDRSTYCVAIQPRVQVSAELLSLAMTRNLKTLAPLNRTMSLMMM